MQVGPTTTPGHIRALRDALGLSQQQFAARLRVSSQTVSRWERGEACPHSRAVTALRRLQAAAKRKGIATSGTNA
ncbi:MAG: helix-turn-helix domain-containing protein [Planctomycetes bacterium]|nr:helix-turn-helix domain-containing protein [Planctomycetota bacterium]